MADLETSGKNEKPETEAYGYDESTLKHWMQELKIAGDADKDYLDKAEQVCKKFYDERKRAEEGEKKAAIFYSTIETLKPNVFWSVPTVDVRPRRKSENPIARLGGQIWERLISYSDEHDQDTQQVLEDIRDDFLIVNRGVPWIRLEAEIGPVEKRIAVSQEEAQAGYSDALQRELEPDEVQQDNQGLFVIEQGEEINSAKTVLDYVPYSDFRCSISKVKAEIRWRARRFYCNRKDLKALVDSESGVDYRDITLSITDEAKRGRSQKEQEQQERYLRAEVWEIQDKESRQTIFVTDGYKQSPLKIADDPLGLEDFWCAPMPLQTGHGRTSVTAWPEYTQWQDQLTAIDELTDRIDRITDSVRVICAADALFQEQLENILKRDNAMVFIPNFRQWAEKNGFAGILDFLNIEPLITGRQALIEQRDREIQLFYEISGYSEIFRGGGSDPRKTASAVHEESTRGSIRLKEKQKSFQRFAKNILRIKAEIIATHYPPQLMKDIAGLDGYGDGVTEQQIDQAIALLKDKKQRAYVIDIETDSTVVANDEQQQKSAAEFLAAVGPLLQQAQAMAGNVAWAKLAKAMVMMASQRYKCGAAMQAEIESALDALVQQSVAMSQQPPQGDPNAQANLTLAQAEMLKAQVSAKKVDQEGQVHAAKMQQENQVKGVEMQQAGAIKAKELELHQQEIVLKAREIAVKEREVGIKAAQALMDGQRVANDVRFKEMDHAEKRAEALTKPIQAEKPQAAPINIELNGMGPL